MDKINSKYALNEISFDIGSLAIQAMMYEVSCFPSPGLVSPISNGSHGDMNFYTFIDSITALNKYMIIFVQEGFSDRSYSDIFMSIRKVGIKAEREMFNSTGGVNTHKGMLFIIGITCAAVGKAIYENKNFKYIKNIIKFMSCGIVKKELNSLKTYKGSFKELTHGEKLFIKYNIKGVRGEVENGIPTVFNFALDFYKNNCDLNINDRLVHTLIGIMQVCNDSTIVYRSSIKTLKYVKDSARYIIKIGGMRSKKGKCEIEKLCQKFVKKNISPGGSADLLGITVFLYSVEKYMKNINL